jgi:glucuronosyltransferase
MRFPIKGFYLLATLALCNGLKILVYQTVFTQSHLSYSNAIVDTLVDRGHLVDKLVMAWNSSIVSNGTSRARKVITVRSSAIKDKSPSKIDVFGNVRVRVTDDSLASTKSTFCSALVDQTTLLDQLRLEKYDVGLTSLFDYCGLGVFHLSGIKSVHGFSPSQSIDGLPQLLGVPTPPSYVTDILDPTVMTDRLSFIERVWNFIDSIRKHFEAEKFFDAQQQIFDDRFKRFPRLIDLFKGMTYVFVNADEVLGIPKPSSPKIKHIGGIAVAEPKKLPRLFERILNIPSKGVVLFSFGSYARTDGLTLRAKRKIANALAKFRDYTFIWKYDNPEEDAAYYQNYTNIFRVRWMPQNDLLRKRYVFHL